MGERRNEEDAHGVTVRLQSAQRYKVTKRPQNGGGETWGKDGKPGYLRNCIIKGLSKKASRRREEGKSGQSKSTRNEMAEEF